MRVALKSVLDELPQLGDDDFVLSRQVNLETIHAHDVVAERHGTVGELRAELGGGGHAAGRAHRRSATGCGLRFQPAAPERRAALVSPSQALDVGAVEEHDADPGRRPERDHRPRVAEQPGPERERGRGR